MSSYAYGCILLVLGSAFLLSALFLIRSGRKGAVPPHQKKLKRVSLPAEFLKEAERAYEITQSIQGMLELLKTRYAKGKIASRITAAEDYLINSRYKDYETTLYHYLSDGSEESRRVYERVIEQEVMKRYRLPCKNK